MWSLHHGQANCQGGFPGILFVLKYLNIWMVNKVKSKILIKERLNHWIILSLYANRKVKYDSTRTKMHLLSNEGLLVEMSKKILHRNILNIRFFYECYVKIYFLIRPSLQLNLILIVFLFRSIINCFSVFINIFYFCPICVLYIVYN